MPSTRALFQALTSRPDPDRTLNLLQALSQAELKAPELIAYHEQLLFYNAYPRSNQMRLFCGRELDRFYRRVQGLKKRDREELEQTGIAGSRINYPYDEAMARWLLERLGERIEIDWETYEEKDDDPLSGYLPLLMEPAENDAIDDTNLTTRKLVELARGKQTSLQWLLERFTSALPDREIRQQIYDPMQVPLTLELPAAGLSRTTLDDGLPEDMFVWDPVAARAPFDLVREIRKPLRIPPPLERRRAKELLDLVYGSLLVRIRELYPATNCNLHEMYDLSLARGIRVIFFFMTPEKRLPLEAGWGCLLLKNNVPIGYGAGGMVADQSEISINIFDTFRGGEAAWLYAQYGRICNQWCRAPWLVTRKWQLGGEGNDEGIESGTFWFYDKLGFRSVDPGLRKLAERERKKIQAGTGYRCSPKILRKLAEADVVFNLDGRSAEEFREFPLGGAGQLASKVIAEQFGGRRKDLESLVLKEMKRRFGVSYETWTKDEKARFAQMSLSVLGLRNVDRFTAGEKRMLIKLCRFKGTAHEADYAALFPYNRKFFEELRKVV